MISVVIPTLNGARSLRSALPPLVDGVVEGLITTVTFIDGGSTDATHEIAEASGAQFVPLSQAVNKPLVQAVERASQWLLFQPQNAVLPPGWMEAARHHMRTQPEGVAIFPYRLAAAGFANRMRESAAVAAFTLSGGAHPYFAALAPMTAIEAANILGGCRDASHLLKGVNAPRVMQKVAVTITLL